MVTFLFFVHIPNQSNRQDRARVVDQMTWRGLV